MCSKLGAQIHDRNLVHPSRVSARAGPLDSIRPGVEVLPARFAFAIRYIATHERDPRGTGGTPYMRWLGQLIDETRALKIH